MAVLEQECRPTLRTYEPNFDTQEYAKKDIKNKLQLDQRTIHQVETLLGERFNVILSKNRYEIKNNIIYGENMGDELFINVIKRGRDYIAYIAGENRVDKGREQAEIDGFLIVQDVLCNANTSIGTMIVSVSPPGGNGSLYKHNFYDIFTLKEEKGERYIEARRYSSALSQKEYREKLEPVYPSLYGKDAPLKDDYFLSHPVVINHSFFQSPDEVHAYLHRNHKYMDEATFSKVLDACRPFVERYIRALSENPADINRHYLILDSILNKADMEADRLRRNKENYYDIFIKPYDEFSLEREIEYLGRQPVREATTQCPGGSSGFGKNKGQSSLGSLLGNPFSVADFGADNEWFTCPKCHYEANGPVGNKCPGCGLTKEDYAEESSEPVCD